MAVPAFVAGGSNLGDRLEFLNQAKEILDSTSGIHVSGESSIFETIPVGGPAQGLYLNVVWEIRTDLTVESFYGVLKGIEDRLDRVRSASNAPRTIDLDLLFYGDHVLKNSKLCVPHPRLQERLFVLAPLLELAPDFRHPVLNQTIRQLYEAIAVKNPADVKNFGKIYERNC